MLDFRLENISSAHKIAYAQVDYKLESELFLKLKRQGINLSELEQMSNLKRKIEWMSIRSILLDVHSKTDDVYYDEHRKPYFVNSNEHLSISHSNEMVAISIHKEQITGIDIQLISDKISTIKSKFLNSEEQKNTSDDPLLLTSYWSIKEALFKVYGKKDIFLKANIEVSDFQFNKDHGTATGKICCNHHLSHHQLHVKRIGKYVLAYTVNS